MIRKESGHESGTDFAALGAKLSRIGAATLGVTAFAYVVWFATASEKPTGKPEAWGQFGDFIGGIAGTIIALLTLWAIGQAIRLQQIEFRTMHAALDEQSRAAKIEVFDSTFFKVMDRLTAMTHGPNAPVRAKGWVDRIKNSAPLLADGDTDRQKFASEYTELFDQHAAELGPFFRTLYFMMEFIDRSGGLDDAQKYRYAKLVRAQFGSNELILIFFNVCFNAEGMTGLKPYVEKYSLLKHAAAIDDPAVLVELRADATVIHPRAFASSEERAANGWT